jgi:hypothetical protein
LFLEVKGLPSLWLLSFDTNAIIEQQHFFGIGIIQVNRLGEFNWTTGS